MKTTKYQDGGYVKTPGKTGARASISKTTKTMSGGTKTKTISGGPLVPNAKGSVTKTKTNADGSLNKTSTKSISGNRASNKISKYQDGGKVTRGDIKDAQREAKLKRIQAGTEPSTYEKVANISGNVAKTAVAAGETAKAVRDTRTGMSGPGGMQKGGATKKYQGGGRVISENAAARKVAKGKGTISKSYPSGPEEKGSYIGYSKEAKKSDSPFISMKNSKPARPIMKTGGMVNSNAKVSASKKATGKVGGISKAPKKAIPTKK